MLKLVSLNHITASTSSVNLCFAYVLELPMSLPTEWSHLITWNEISSTLSFSKKKGVKLRNRVLYKISKLLSDSQMQPACSKSYCCKLACALNDQTFR